MASYQGGNISESSPIYVFNVTHSPMKRAQGSLASFWLDFSWEPRGADDIGMFQPKGDGRVCRDEGQVRLAL